MAETVREAVGVFETPERLQDAVADLESSGFDHADISLLASEAAVEEKLGHRYERVEEMMSEPDAPRQAFVSKEVVNEGKAGVVGGLSYVGATIAAGAVVASGGTGALALGAALAAAGGGGALGAVLAGLFGKAQAQNLQEQLERGGLLLWVRIPSDETEEKALEILKRHGASHVHAQDVPV